MGKIFFKLFGLGCITAVMCLLYGFLVEPKTLKIRNAHIVSPTWNSAPLKIALIADIHIGGWHVNDDRVAMIVNTINEHSPDIVLIAGDFVSGHDKASDRSDTFNAEIKKGMAALSGLQSPFGTYASIGNHDDWYDGSGIKRMLKLAGVGVLDNAAKTITNNSSSFCLVGLPDDWTGELDPAVFARCGAENMIAFMHSPDSFTALPPTTNLALAGHTHGGQINIPLIGRRVNAIDLDMDFAYGEVNYNGIPGFVTAGIGTSILPARFRAPPEIVLIHLSGA